ncbi:MAG TPA: endolytic transglycosylase MltG [Gammaproteobacteria bacterium]|nr:endolytic transglycosylase MltG [Gammaproteobacteria bacterium]
MKQTLLVITLFLSAISLAVAWWVWNDMQNELTSPVNISGPVSFEIKNGTSLQAVAVKLHKQGIIKQPYYLVFEARREGTAGMIKAGEYLLQPGKTPRQLLQQFISGDVRQYALTLVEGWTVRDMLAVVEEDSVLEQSLQHVAVENLMMELGYPGLSPEGQFFPDTYHFPRGTTDIAFLKRAHTALQRVLEEEWQARDDNLPYQSPYEALILASIIEKETGVPEERAQIAGVFVRRLQRGMRLQTDPTVIYAMQESFDGNIRSKDLQIDSPYNTYLYAGLPPTPIALAGRESIQAALHPADGKALYFVAKGDGSHHFSKTLEEHNRAVAKYQLDKEQ